MTRIRTIKPEFFRHAELFDAERSSGLPLRVAFAGLWCAADREGRFRWLPRELKLDCLPYDEADFQQVLEALSKSGFVVKYQVNGSSYGVIPTFRKHQQVNVREQASKLPPPPKSTCMHITETVPQTIQGTLQLQEKLCGEGEGEKEKEDNSESKDSSLCTLAPKKGARRPKGTRLAPDWEPSPQIDAWANQQLGPQQAQLEFDKFCDYWEAKAGPAAFKLDWDKTFRNWIRTAKERKPNGQA